MTEHVQTSAQGYSPEASAAGQRLRGRMNEDVRNLDLCWCERPLPARMYLGRWACAKCGRLLTKCWRVTRGGDQ